jgi:ribonuclease HII
VSLFSFDRSYYKRGYKVIAGIDEAGRGPWAGPVVAAAVVLPEDVFIEGLNDSKKLSPHKREILFSIINKMALAVGIETVDHETIDSVNILNAAHIAMRNALAKLSVPQGLALVDGLPVKGLSWESAAIIGGDGKSASIAAASIIAKVTRDRIMSEYSKEYPEYSFQKHKGYGTKEHHDAILAFGPCPIHRKSFMPLKKYLLEGYRQNSYE